jgi:phosphoribosylglycinamide formyltransferase-1
MRLAIFASGNGSNMEAITQAIKAGIIPADLVLCITNNPGAGVIARADTHEVPISILRPKDFADSRFYVHTLLNTLERHRVNFIALAGYMLKIPDDVVGSFEGRMLNIHPALLPSFGGKGMYGHHVHEAVLDYGVRWTGVTVHVVDKEYDHGPVVLQEPVEILPGDTPDSVAERIHPVEHRLYPEAIRLFAEGRVSINGRSVSINRD